MVDKEKIDEILEFFKTENKKLENWYSKKDKRNKYSFTQLLSIAGTFIAVFIALITAKIAILESFAGIIFITIIIGIYLFFYNRGNDEIFNEYVEEATKLEVIISFFQNLKITEPKETNITPLIEKFDQYFRDNRMLLVSDYNKLWIKEFIDIINKVNNEIIGIRKNNP